MTARPVAVDVWFSAILDAIGSFTVSTGPVSPSFTEHFTFATVVPAEVCFNKENADCSCTQLRCVYFVRTSASHVGERIWEHFPIARSKKVVINLQLFYGST